MKKFEEGQKVICKHPTGMWLGVFPGPFRGDIVTVSGISVIHPGWLELAEYPVSRCGNELPDCFAPYWFEPLQDYDVLEIEEAIEAGKINLLSY